MSDIKYVIYCRKSTVDKERQVQSIADQIKYCVQFAEHHGYEIMERPEDFSEFETEEEIQHQLEQEDSEIYENTRHLFVVKETKSGKIPKYREKRKALIKLVKKGKVKGIISYAPDRQARNMVDGGELIDLVDNEKIDLRYPTFDFTPNANGKMMLGIGFVFAKQYADNLGENAKRGQKSSLEKGHAMNTVKRGYTINSEGFHQPDDDNFKLLRQAFEMKMHQKKSNKQICEWLINRGFKKPTQEKEIFVDPKPNQLNGVRKDPFYYGLHIYGANEIDLRLGKNSYREPIITEKEYDYLSFLVEESASGRNPTKTDNNTDIKPLVEGFLVAEDGRILSHNLPNKKRFMEKFEKLLKTNPNATIQELVQPHQIKYSSRPKGQPEKNLTISYDVIDTQIRKFLSKLEITEESYDMYRKKLGEKFTQDSVQNSADLRIIQLRYNKMKSERDEYIAKMMEKSLDDDENIIYLKKKSGYNARLASLKDEMEVNNDEMRNTIFEFEALCRVAMNLVSYFENADYVRRGRIIQIFCSNIIIDNQKRLHFAVKPGLDILFSSKGSELWGTRTRT